MAKVFSGVSSIPLPVIDWSKDYKEIDAQIIIESKGCN